MASYVLIRKASARADQLEQRVETPALLDTSARHRRIRFVPSRDVVRDLLYVGATAIRCPSSKAPSAPSATPVSSLEEEERSELHERQRRESFRRRQSDCRCRRDNHLGQVYERALEHVLELLCVLHTTDCSQRTLRTTSLVMFERHASVSQQNAIVTKPGERPPPSA